MAGFFMATFFHGAMIIGGIVFFLIVFLVNIKKMFKLLIKFRLNFKFLIYLSSIAGLVFYILTKVHIPYLESFDYATNLSTLFQKTTINTKGDASWPTWLIISSPVEMFYKLPLRSIYFMYAPFPWDVSQARHLAGMLDSFLYIYLTFLIFKNKKNIWRDPALRVFLIILIFYIIVFAIGAGNFGTGIRHRSKFVVLFILLAAPLIKKFIFDNKNKFFSNKFEKISK